MSDKDSLMEDWQQRLAERGPLCPLEIPSVIWEEVAKGYHTEDWRPGPNYYPEYRDAWTTYKATIKLAEVICPGLSRDIKMFEPNRGTQNGQNGSNHVQGQ